MVTKIPAPIERWIEEEAAYHHDEFYCGKISIVGYMKCDPVRDFKAGATFATNLTFERVIEALREQNGTSMGILTSYGWADWLIANREKIIGDKNE